MGGGSSKQSAYVLRVANGEGSVETVSFPPASPPTIGALARQDSKVNSATSGTSPLPGALLKQNSKQSSLRNLGGMTPQLSKRSASMTMGSGRKMSARVPWLMKEGNFSNIDLCNFDFGRVIGRGLMGSVRIAKNKQHAYYVAIKSIKKDYIQRHRDQRHISAEREVLAGLSGSPFCVRLFGTCQDALHVHFVMELAVGGELFRRLKKKQAFPAPVAKFYASEIFCALRHIHKLGFVYRDLKPENIMLDEEGHCKLVDFGFAMKPDAQGLLHTQCGTPAYLSPEQLNGKFTNGYTAIVDWWSFGILLYELLTGNTPFCKSYKESSYEIYLRILDNHISFPFGFDSVTKELVCQLCHADLSKRLVDPEVIAASRYWEIPWEHVNSRRLVPPHIPRVAVATSGPGTDDNAQSGLNIGGDTSQFDTYSGGDAAMEGIKPGGTVDFNGY